MWIFLLLSSLVALIIKAPDTFVYAAIKGANQSTSLAIKLIATYGFWLGLFEIIDKIGISDNLAKALKPAINFLFPGCDYKTQKYIAMNMSANILGLGNASTPMGINAIISMDDHKKHATTNMIMLLIISTTSLQLLPSTVIAMRVQHASGAPTGFLVPCMIATTVSTLLGIICVKLISFIINIIKNKTSIKIKKRAKQN